MRLTARLLPALLALTLVSACVHRIDVQQGNVITPEMLAEVQPGMTKREVRFLLGTPLVTDPFHAERWDYFYALRKGRETQRQQQLVTLEFEDDRLARIVGEPEETVVETAEAVETQKPAKSREKQGFFKRMWSKVRRKNP